VGVNECACVRARVCVCVLASVCVCACKCVCVQGVEKIRKGGRRVCGEDRKRGNGDKSGVLVTEMDDIFKKDRFGIGGAFHVR